MGQCDEVRAQISSSSLPNRNADSIGRDLWRSSESRGGSSGEGLEAVLPSPKNVVAPASKRGPHSTIEIGEQV